MCPLKGLIKCTARFPTNKEQDWKPTAHSLLKNSSSLTTLHSFVLVPAPLLVLVLVLVLVSTAAGTESAAAAAAAKSQFLTFFSLYVCMWLIGSCEPEGEHPHEQP